MEVTLKQFFNLGDGRLSTEMGDVYQMLNYIFDANLMTHQLPTAIRRLEEHNPEWFKEGVGIINKIKNENETNDFEFLMRAIYQEYSHIKIKLGKINETIPFSSGLIPEINNL